MDDAAPPVAPPAPARKTVGMVSLGCPKALVDSERILTRLRGEGYAVSPTYEGADAVVVNTCAFLDSARAESLEAIAEAERSGKPVIVTGCLGAEEATVRAAVPGVAAVTGAHAYDAVTEAVRRHAPQTISAEPFAELTPMSAAGLKLTPRHFAYLKIGEGCDHKCSFCIIPALRGPLSSRPVDEVLREAEALVEAGVKEILVVSQDTSAYGLDRRYAPGVWRGRERSGDLLGLAEGLGELGVWVRLHYVYPYPHVDKVIPLMRPGALLPYLDIPFQHADPAVLKRMRRPAAADRTLERLARWRAVQPELVVRSTFVVGFPGETDAEFEHLLSWLEEARLDRVGAFAYEDVRGAAANALPDHVPEPVKQERRERLMATAARISRDKLRLKVGRTLSVLVDALRPDGTAVARTEADAPEVDGVVHVRGAGHLRVGELARVRVERTDAFDLHAVALDAAASAIAAAPRRLHRVISRR